ncbi:YicC family protein [Candidatus Poribacteria bacterium]|nr:YicC family protein [Candidatus Poribacteria bacterium]
MWSVAPASAASAAGIELRGCGLKRPAAGAEGRGERCARLRAGPRALLTSSRTRPTIGYCGGMLPGSSLGRGALMRSMTGFGRSETSSDIGSLTTEIRSVNHRYCQVSASLPSEFAQFEPTLSTEIKGRGARGQIHVHGSFQRSEGAGRPVTRVNHALAREVERSARALAARHGVAGAVGVESLLLYPGVLTVEAPDVDEGERGDLLREGVATAWAALDEMRLREGESLRAELNERLTEIRRLREAIAPYTADITARQVERLSRRIDELLAGHNYEPDESRVVVEAGLIAERADVAEELARLGSHCDQFEAFLDEEGQVGRKMDFLLQELNREANTIASKAADGQVMSLCVDLKTEIERLREQVQNVE